MVQKNSELERIKKQVLECRRILADMKTLASLVKHPKFLAWMESSGKDNTAAMSEISPVRSSQMIEYLSDLQDKLPTNFQISRNLARHIGFNQVADWLDLYGYDIENELANLSQYEAKLVLVGKIEQLHDSLSVVESLVLIGRYDEALMAAFKQVELRIKTMLGGNLQGMTGVPMVGKAFSSSEPMIVYKDLSRQEAVRNFLSGVIGLYRNQLMHEALAPDRENLEDCFWQLVIASEAHKVLDDCKLSDEQSPIDDPLDDIDLDSYFDTVD